MLANTQIVSLRSLARFIAFARIERKKQAAIIGRSKPDQNGLRRLIVAQIKSASISTVVIAIVKLTFLSKSLLIAHLVRFQRAKRKYRMHRESKIDV